MANSESGELEPEDQKRLEGVVPGDVVEENAEGERLDKGESAEDDPVSQPLNIVLRSRCFERLEGQIGGEGPAKEVRDGCSERVEGVEEEEENDGANDQVSLGDLSAFFQRLQRGVVVELSSVV